MLTENESARLLQGSRDSFDRILEGGDGIIHHHVTTGETPSPLGRVLGAWPQSNQVSESRNSGGVSW